MIDTNIITARLLELDKRVSRVTLLRRADANEYARDDTAAELTAFNLMLAVQCAIDLAAHLVADRDWRPTTTSAEAFDRLSEHGVMPADLPSGSVRPSGSATRSRTAMHSSGWICCTSPQARAWMT